MLTKESLSSDNVSTATGTEAGCAEAGKDPSFLISAISVASLAHFLLKLCVFFPQLLVSSSSSLAWGELRFYSSPLGDSHLSRALSAQESVGFFLLEVVGVRERDLVSPEKRAPALRWSEAEKWNFSGPVLSTLERELEHPLERGRPLR
ncbi:hypothetical protein MRX96_012746 [Rhipicephalus microplus]